MKNSGELDYWGQPDFPNRVRRTNETYRGEDGNWTRDNLPFSTTPCSAQEALDLAVQIQEKLRDSWRGIGGFYDGIDLGLAAGVLEAWSDIRFDRKPEEYDKLKKESGLP